MFRDKVVLVTGGTGSFGRKFVEVVLAKNPPRKLIVFSRDELKQHEMRAQFPDTGDSPMRYFIGDVRDASRLQRAFHGVDYVVHAAALKQVPTCEYNPIEAVLTNVIGARNVIDAAIDQRVKKVIALSTDKAVNPINLYGATKLCAEKLFVQGNSYSIAESAHFACARYGNVVGSRGSVIPIFLEQAKTGTITITDERMTRFWLTLEQGVEFVLKCLERMEGGEIYVPKIPSMSMKDLARAIAPDCVVKLIGIRPGEKLHEVLIGEDESRSGFELADHYLIQPAHPQWSMEPPAGARPLPDGFRYGSDTNADRLTVEKLLRLVAR